MGSILIAEDDPVICKLIASVVRSAGFEVICAGNGQEAISIFRSSPDQIDLIITDLMMPIMDGYEVVRQACEIRPGMRIVCMSGYADASPPDGVSFLRKPFRLSSLCEVLPERGKSAAT